MAADPRATSGRPRLALAALAACLLTGMGWRIDGRSAALDATPPTTLSSSNTLWRTPLGEAMKAQQLGHLEAIAGIMRERKAQGRTRLMHPTKDTATAEGVIALACGVDERGAELEGELDVEETDNG